MEKFNYEPNGYNRKEVNQFISDVIDQTSGIVKKYTEQKRKNTPTRSRNLKTKRRSRTLSSHRIQFKRYNH